jgi:hypothetical protein
VTLTGSAEAAESEAAGAASLLDDEHPAKASAATTMSAHSDFFFTWNFLPFYLSLPWMMERFHQSWKS